MSNHDKILKLLDELQFSFASLDLIEEKKSGSGLELIILRRKPITLRIDPDKNHKRPHFHIDYGRELHKVSIAIDTGEVLAGELENKYLKEVRKWLTENRTTLSEIYTSLQESKDVKQLMASLQ